MGHSKRPYGKKTDKAIADPDFAALSDAELCVVALLARQRRTGLAILHSASAELELVRAIESRIAAELSRRRGIAA